MDRVLEPEEGDRVIWIAAGATALEGRLAMPERAPGLVLLSWIHDPGSQYLAHALRMRGFATLIVDPLTADERVADDDRQGWRTTERQIAILDWIARTPRLGAQPLGILMRGADVAPALIAASERPRFVRALCALGGNPSLAGSALPDVQAATLLIVGGEDVQTIGENREALEDLPAGDFAVVVGAKHRFAEAGALAEAARLAAEWFERHLAASRAEART